MTPLKHQYSSTRSPLEIEPMNLLSMITQFVESIECLAAVIIEALELVSFVLLHMAMEVV
jgi:hypothetical protein